MRCRSSGEIGMHASSVPIGVGRQRLLERLEKVWALRGVVSGWIVPVREGERRKQEVGSTVHRIGTKFKVPGAEVSQEELPKGTNKG